MPQLFYLLYIQGTVASYLACVLCEIDRSDGDNASGCKVGRQRCPQSGGPEEVKGIKLCADMD
jgi:hypothetical protein